MPFIDSQTDASAEYRTFVSVIAWTCSRISLSILSYASIVFLVFFMVSCSDKVEYSSQDLYRIDSLAEKQLQRGDTTTVKAMLEAWHLRHAPPRASYDSAATANLYARLAAIYWSSGDTLISGLMYDVSYPYLHTRPDSVESDMLRYAAYAFRSRGTAADSARALRRILEAMRIADAAGDSVRFQKALACWRSLMDASAVRRIGRAGDERSFLWWGVLISVIVYAWKLRLDRPPGPMGRRGRGVRRRP